jgi:sugar lactone lactonase YvrE
MFLRAAILLTLYTLVHPDTRAQDFLYAVRHFKIEPGKQGNFIRCMVRDDAGLLWLGTIRGLVRYNGYEFDRPMDAISDWRMPSSDVMSLAVGGDSLFIGTKRGLKVLDLKKFKPISIPGYDDNGAPILAAKHDASTGFWWFREDGYLFNFFRSRLRVLPMRMVSPVDIRISGQHVWVSGNLRIEKTQDRTGILYRVEKLTMRCSEVLRSHGVIDNPMLYEDDRGGIVYVHGTKNIRLPQSSGEPNGWFSESSRFDMRAEVGAHRFMVLNQHQLIHEYRSAGQWKRTLVNLNVTEPFSITKLLPVGDRLLLATSAGLVNVSYRRNAFEPIRSTLIPRDGLYEDPRGITEDDENIYVAGYHSISAWKKSDGSLRLINAEDLLTHGMILHDKHLWLSTEGNGLIRMDPVTGKYIELVKDTIYRNNFLISNAVWGDTILTGGYRSFSAYLPAKDIFLHPVIRHDSIVVSDQMIKKILPLDGNRCLLGTDKGVFIIGRDFSILKHMRPPDPDERPGIDIINDVVLGRDGSIWAATFYGVIKLDSSGRTVRHISHQDGLSGDFVASLALDARGGLWAGTYEGLSRIDTSNGRIENFFKADGLPDDEFNHSSVHVARSGDIFMGTISGFIRFDPNMSSRSSGLQQRIRISRAEYGYGEDVSVHLDFPFLNTETLRIGPDVKYLKLHFYADPVQISEQSIYEYRIDGVHERWMKMGPSPTLHIDNARSGKYKLHVRFISGTGSDEIIEQSFPLVVEQYFYTRPAFYTAIIGTMLIFIILYVRAILVRDRRLMEVRQELAADLHDEVGGYLTGLLMKIDIMTKGAMSREYQLVNLRNLASKAIFGLKDGLWSLDTKTDNAQQLWDRFRRIAQESLEPLDIPYRFSGVQGLSNVPLMLIEKRNMLFTLKECLNNAIKHGDGKGVWFDWKIGGDGTHTIIVRNGVRSGDDADESEGLGLDNMQRRIRRIRGALVTYHREGLFTVEININLRHDKIGRD